MFTKLKHFPHLPSFINFPFILNLSHHFNPFCLSPCIIATTEDNLGFPHIQEITTNSLGVSRVLATAKNKLEGRFLRQRILKFSLHLGHYMLKFSRHKFAVINRQPSIYAEVLQMDHSIECLPTRVS